MTSITGNSRWVNLTVAGNTVFPDNCYQDAKSRVSFPSAKYPVAASPICIASRLWVDSEQSNWGGDRLLEIQEAWKALNDAGINFIDTGNANNNGESELIVSELVHGLPRDNFVIQTKYISPQSNTISIINSGDALITSLLNTLKRLRLDYVDIYLISGPIPSRCMTRYAEGIGQCVERGLTRAVGVADCDKNDLMRMYDELSLHNIPLAVNQHKFSILEQQPELPGIVGTCRDNGIIFQSCLSLMEGRPFSESVVEGQMASKEDGFGDQDNEELEKLLETLRAIAEPRGKSIAAVVLNYNMNRRVLSVVDLRNVDHAKRVVEAFGWRLNEQELADIDQIIDLEKDLSLSYRI